jgi:hypothetical protein
VILLDADDDCAAVVAQALLDRARAARGDRKIAVVVAVREYEAWFLAAAGSLRGVQGLPDDLTGPLHPEDVRGAKEWLGSRISSGAYSPTVDQRALTSRFDLELARRNSPSFDKWCREVARILGCARSAP